MLSDWRASFGHRHPGTSIADYIKCSKTFRRSGPSPAAAVINRAASSAHQSTSLKIIQGTS